MGGEPDWILLKYSWKYCIPLVPVAALSKAQVCGRSPDEILGSNPAGGMDDCCECCVFSSRGLCDELITRTKKPYWLWCVIVCDIETSKMRTPWHTLGRSARVGGGRGEYAISRSRSCCDKMIFDRPDLNIFPPLNEREKSNLPRSFNR